MESAEEERRDTGQAEGGREGLGAGRFSLPPKLPPPEQSSAEEKTTKKSLEPGRRSVVHRAVLLE